MAAQAKIEIQIHSASVCIVTLRGEHDAASRDAVTLALAAARSYGNILVDLAQCTFVDSSLISALLVAAKRACQLDGALELVLPAEANAVRRTLEIANVQMILPFHASREDAIAAMTAPEERRALRRPALRAVDAQPAPAVPAGSPRAGTTVVRAQVVADSLDLDETDAIGPSPAKPRADRADWPDTWGEQAA